MPEALMQPPISIGSRVSDILPPVKSSAISILVGFWPPAHRLQKKAPSGVILSLGSSHHACSRPRFAHVHLPVPDKARAATITMELLRNVNLFSHRLSEMHLSSEKTMESRVVTIKGKGLPLTSPFLTLPKSCVLVPRRSSVFH